MPWHACVCERERIVGLLAKSFFPVRQTCGREEAGGAALGARSPLMLAHVSCVVLYAMVVQHSLGTSRRKGHLWTWLRRCG